MELTILIVNIIKLYLQNNILPHLHIKTHYKTATQFTLAYPGSFYWPTTTNLEAALEKAKSDREKLSQRNLFNAFKNIECKKIFLKLMKIKRNLNNNYWLDEQKGVTKVMRQSSQAIENQEVDISKLTK